jgi:hypothetical protein
MAVVMIASVVMACEQGPRVTTTDVAASSEVTTAGLMPMAGQWELHTTLWTDCPSEWHRTLPQGPTQWQVTDEGVSIQGTMASGAPLWLRPTSERTLEQENVVTAYNCEVTESLVLVIDRLESPWAEGVFSARLSHDGGDACQALATEAGLPDQCETIVQWRGRRTSGVTGHPPARSQ